MNENQGAESVLSFLLSLLAMLELVEPVLRPDRRVEAWEPREPTRAGRSIPSGHTA